MWGRFLNWRVNWFWFWSSHSAPALSSNPKSLPHAPLPLLHCKTTSSPLHHLHSKTTVSPLPLLIFSIAKPPPLLSIISIPKPPSRLSLFSIAKPPPLSSDEDPLTEPILPLKHWHMGPTKRGAHLSATERQGNLSSPSSPFQSHRLASSSSLFQDHRLSSHLPKLAPDHSEGHLWRGCSSESGRSPAATRQS